MLATNGPRFFDRPTPDPRWPSVGVSLLLTAAMFASALTAMRTLGPWRNALELSPEKPVVVRLTPPTVPAPPEPTPARRSAPFTAAPTSVQTTIPPVAAPATVNATPVSPSIAVPVPAAAPATADSGAGHGVARGNAGSATAGSYVGGAPIARSGFVVPTKPLTPAARDSILRIQMESIVEMAKRPPTGAIAAEMDESKRIADRMRRRATTAGNGREVVVMNGQGKDGVGAVGNPNGGTFAGPGVVGYSIPFPLFYPGPSPEQRKRNEAIDRDNQARFKRLDDRAKFKRDSIRADSIAKARKVIP